MAQEKGSTQEQSLVLFSILCGVFAAITGFIKATSLSATGGLSARLSVYSLFIALLAIMFCFFTLLLSFWSNTTEQTTLVQQRAQWKWTAQLFWWLQTVFYVGTCLFVFFSFETGAFSLSWKYSSSIAFALGLGQIGFFAFHFRTFDKHLQSLDV